MATIWSSRSGGRKHLNAAPRCPGAIKEELCPIRSFDSTKIGNSDCTVPCCGGAGRLSGSACAHIAIAVGVTSGASPRLPVSSLQDEVVPHIIARSQHLRLGKFGSSGAKRVLQHNRHFSDMARCPSLVRNTLQSRQRRKPLRRDDDHIRGLAGASGVVAIGAVPVVTILSDFSSSGLNTNNLSCGVSMACTQTCRLTPMSPR
jgi:hypothetical protein